MNSPAAEAIGTGGAPRSTMRVQPVIDAIGLLLLAFVLYTSAVLPLDPTVHRGSFLIALLCLGLLLKPLAGWWRLVDLVLFVAAMASIGYLVINAEELAYRANFAPGTLEVVFAFAAVIAVLELTRRTVGLPLAIVALAAIAYARFGQSLPEPFTHKGYSVARLVANQYLTPEGLFGSMLGVASTLVAAFILFGCALQHVGTANLFMQIAARVSRGSYGGPAKLAVVGSALMGTMSGSSTANVMTTGTTTIPMMIRAGFSRPFAAATEAVASTGGQIMPPVMGVAAFLMAELTGIPYATIAIAAVVPAVLYYIAVYFEVDLEARRLKLKVRVDGDDTPWSRVARQLHLFLPLAILVWLLLAAYSASKAAFWASVTAIVVGLPQGRALLQRDRLLSTLRMFVAAMVTVGFACATAGIVVGALNLTGIGLQMTYVLVELSGNRPLLLLVFVMVVCIILGMGLPTPAAYAVAAAFAGPMLITVGYEKLNAHLFLLYFASLSSITPPVAIAAFAGASIAGSRPMQTGFLAWKLGAAAFIVPFMFVGDDALFLGHGGVLDTIQAIVTACVGVFALAVASIGYLRAPISAPGRLAWLATALLLIAPSPWTGAAGVLALIILLGVHRMRQHRWE